MKKETKKQIAEKIHVLREEAERIFLNIENLQKEATRKENIIKNAIKENEEKVYNMVANIESLRERIEFKKANADKFNFYYKVIADAQAELKISDIIKNIIDEYISDIQHYYSYNVISLFIENVRNTRDKNEFLEFYDYYYNREEERYIYNNICTLHLSDSRFVFNFKNANFKAFNEKKRKTEIWTDCLENSYYTNYKTVIRSEFFDDDERMKKEVERIRKELKKAESKIDEFIYKYNNLKGYVTDIIKINNNYNDKIKRLEEEKNQAINEADLFDLKNLILKEV